MLLNVRRKGDKMIKSIKKTPYSIFLALTIVAVVLLAVNLINIISFLFVILIITAVSILIAKRIAKPIFELNKSAK